MRLCGCRFRGKLRGLILRSLEVPQVFLGASSSEHHQSLLLIARYIRAVTKSEQNEAYATFSSLYAENPREIDSHVQKYLVAKQEKLHIRLYKRVLPSVVRSQEFCEIIFKMAGYVKFSKCFF